MKASQQPIESADGLQDVALNIRSEFPVPTYDEWRETVVQDLKGADFDKKLLWKTDEGITVRPLYVRADLEGCETAGQLPGFPPFARGTNLLSGVSPSWQIRQDMMLAAPEDANAALRDALARGQDAIGIRLDNAARLGLDGDDPEAKGLSGRGGCTISSINGIRLALQDIDLLKYPITIRTGTAALPVLAMLLALADERKIKRSLLVGAVEFDPIRELAKAGRLRAPLSLHYREMADAVKFCAEQCPGIRPIMVNTQHWHNAGGSAVQELGYGISTAIAYMRELMAQGIDANKAAMSMIFSFSVSTNFFMEIAKLRAARMLWAKAAKALGVTDENGLKMFLHVRTSTYNKTLYDPYNNMVRNAIEGFAGAVGGVDSMYIAPFDETFRRPDDFSMRIARNQHVLLQEEAHLKRVVDPAGGSYYVESLTDSVARAAWELIQQVDREAGIVQAMKAGTVQKAIAEVSDRKKKAVASRRQPIVGVSNYPKADESIPEGRHLVREEFLAERRRRLKRLKSVRRNSAVAAALDKLSAAIQDPSQNILPPAIEAVAEGATLGEVLRALGDGAVGEMVEVPLMNFDRAAAMYERLRTRMNLFAGKYGERPRVFLAPMGHPAMRRARMDFCLGFFGAGGFHITEPNAFKAVEDAANAALADKARIVVACADDPTYPGIVPELVKRIKEADSTILVYVAGYPTESIEALQAAGVDGFVHIKANCAETLSDIMDRIGL